MVKSIFSLEIVNWLQEKSLHLKYQKREVRERFVVIRKREDNHRVLEWFLTIHQVNE